MKKERQIIDFIQLRIEGKSFDEIAKQLKTSKSTLIQWNKNAEIKTEIAESKAIAINTLVKAYEYDKQARLKALLKLSKKINDELLNRNLTDVSTDTLLKMSISNDNRINSIIGNTVEFGSSEIDDVFFSRNNDFFKMQLDE